MRNGKIVNRIAALFALFIVLFQTFAFPVMAVQPWTGNSWEGNSWQGNSWEGNSWKGTPWKGKSWQGESWSGQSWNGDSWDGSDFQGSDWEGTPGLGNDWSGESWSSNDWSMQGFGGHSWTNPGYEGNSWNNPGYNGNPWNSPGYHSDPWSQPGYDGNPWNHSGYQGAPWLHPGYEGGSWNSPGSEYRPWIGGPIAPIGGAAGTQLPAAADRSSPSPWEVGRFMGENYIGGQISMIGDYMDGTSTFGPAGSYMSGLLLGGLKMGLGDRTPWYIDTAIGVQEVAEVGQASYQAGKTLVDLSRGGAATTTMMRGATTVAPATAAISKFTLAGAAIGTGFSAYDTVKNTANAVNVLKSDARGTEKVSATADATASLGSTILNAGVLVSAVPGGQAVGAAMVVGGAALWGASKVTKLVANNWDKVKGAAKKTGEFISNGWRRLGSLFGG